MGAGKMEGMKSRLAEILAGKKEPCLKRQFGEILPDSEKKQGPPKEALEFSGSEKKKLCLGEEILEFFSDSENLGKAKHSLLVAVFAWFTAALLLNSIFSGLLFSIAVFFAGFAVQLYCQREKRRNYGKRVEALLPFLLMDIAIELNLGVDFLTCLKSAAKQRNEAGKEFKRVVLAIERQGATVQEALLQMAKRVNSRMLNRSIVQLVAVFEQGGKTRPGEGIKRIATEILTRQKIESRLFSGKLVVLSLLFIAISAIVPGLFQSFTIVGSMILQLRFTALQAFITIAVVFPLIDLCILFYIRNRTPVFLRS